MSKLKKDIPTGCCECREKTPMEIIRERIKDEHELEIVLRGLARLHHDSFCLREKNRKLIRDNETLVYGLIKSLENEKQSYEYAKAKEEGEAREYILNDLKRNEVWR